MSTFRYSRKSQHIKPYQRDAIFHEKRFGVVEGTTKCGKTYCCLVWIFERFMLGKMGWNFWWVAPSVSQAKIAYRRLRRAINRLPALTRAFFKFNDTELTCTGPNGQVLRFLTGENFSLILQQVMVVGVLAIGQTLVILTAGIDLSCGMVMSLGGVVMALLAARGGVAPAATIAWWSCSAASRC